MINYAFLSVRLFQNTSPVSLCSCGLCPFILLNYCTVVHYKRGNKSKEGKIGFETKAVFTLGARALSARAPVQNGAVFIHWVPDISVPSSVHEYKGRDLARILAWVLEKKVRSH